MSAGTGAFGRWSWYFLYAVVLTATLLYVRFPKTQFKNYCARQAEDLFKGTACRIGRISYAFPLGLRFEDVAFSLPGQEKQPQVLLTSLSLSPVLADLRNTLALQGKGYSGQFSGILHRVPKEKRFSLDAIKIQNLHLVEMKPLQDALGRELSGQVDFSGSYSGIVNQYLAGKLEGKLAIGEGKISLVQPIFALNALDLNQMEMEVKYDQQNLQISKGKMKGTELSADFSGTVNVISPWQLSQMTAAGDIALQAGFMKENPQVQREIALLKKQFKKTTIPFRINGSLQKPTFRFGV